jgi:hypothetical protein
LWRSDYEFLQKLVISGRREATNRKSRDSGSGPSIALIVAFIFMWVPVGLGATLIVAGLILRRAGPW